MVFRPSVLRNRGGGTGGEAQPPALPSPPCYGFCPRFAVVTRACAATLEPPPHPRPSSTLFSEQRRLLDRDGIVGLCHLRIGDAAGKAMSPLPPVGQGEDVRHPRSSFHRCPLPLASTAPPRTFLCLRVPRHRSVPPILHLDLHRASTPVPLVCRCSGLLEEPSFLTVHRLHGLLSVVKRRKNRGLKVGFNNNGLISFDWKMGRGTKKGGVSKGS